MTPDRLRLPGNANHLARLLDLWSRAPDGPTVGRARRYKIKLDYKAKPFATIAFEMSVGEGRSLDAPEIVYPAVSLAPVQLPDPDEIAFLPVAYQIAQKIHACTEAPTPEHANDRVRDLYDILLVGELIPDDGYAKVLDACREIFELRGKHPWPPIVSSQPSWALLWANIASDEGFDLTLDQAIANVSSLVRRIAEA